MQANQDARPDIPLWSETRWFGCFSPDTEAGFFIHAGRFRKDLDLWWAQTAAYLPDGSVAVDRSWGSSGDCSGVQTGVLVLRRTEREGIRCTFDGAMERLSPMVLARRPGGAGTSARVSWELTAERVGTLWDMMAGRSLDRGFVGGTHTQEHYQVTGAVRVDGQTIPINGPGFDDHSTGPRDWTGFGSHIFVSAQLPDHRLIAVAMRDPTGAMKMAVGAHMPHDDQLVRVTGADAPPLQSALGDPRTFELSVKRADGGQHTYGVEILCGYPCTTTDTNDNINGIDWDAPGDPLVFVECLARLTAPDGSTGHGHLERALRRSRINRADLSIRLSARTTGAQLTDATASSKYSGEHGNT